MSEYLKPQSPLQHKDGAYIYPLTTADQVILENGNRLNTALNDMSSKPKAGFIYPLASSIVPDGFLLCDGAEYSRVQYEELFAAIGTIYGNGDGSTTFNVPNLQTRVPVGAGNGYGLGSTGGEATHTLTVDEMPSHDHKSGIGGYYAYGGIDRTGFPAASSSASYWTGMADISTSSTGGSQPHNNMQPYTVVNYIIATGKDTGVSVSDIVLGAQAIPLGVEYGGTGATNAADARRNLGIPVRNLLDNSDFTNPVNQRGQTSYVNGSYGLDRWTVFNSSFSGTITIETGVDGTKFTSFDGSGIGIGQRFIDKNYYERKYTCRAKASDGTIIEGYTEAVDAENAVYCCYFWFTSGAIIEWAAMYEGEYTAETLPEYQPKGYGAELAECQRYYYQSWTGDISANGYCGFNAGGAYSSPGVIQFPVRMRIAPTITILTHLGEVGYIRDWTTSKSIPSCVATYVGTDRATLTCSDGLLSAGSAYAYHYTASADL